MIVFCRIKNMSISQCCFNKNSRSSCSSSNNSWDLGIRNSRAKKSTSLHPNSRSKTWCLCFHHRSSIMTSQATTIISMTFRTKRLTFFNRMVVSSTNRLYPFPQHRSWILGDQHCNNQSLRTFCRQMQISSLKLCHRRLYSLRNKKKNFSHKFKSR